MKILRVPAKQKLSNFATRAACFLKISLNEEIYPPETNP
jgi:hypothetical protein